jgi:hypothetical protein
LNNLQVIIFHRSSSLEKYGVVWISLLHFIILKSKDDESKLQSVCVLVVFSQFN